MRKREVAFCTVLLLGLFFSSFVAHAEASLSEIEGNIMNPSFSWEKTPMFCIDKASCAEATVTHMIQTIKKTNPKFKEAMYYYYHYENGGYEYNVSVDYKTYECSVLIINKAELASSPKLMNEFMATRQNNKAVKKEKLQTKYCEKLYGIYFN